MLYIKKILELVSSLGTPSFHSNIGQLIYSETQSNKLVMIRNIDNIWIVLDAKKIVPSKLEYTSLEEILSEFQLENIFEFPFSTYILCDGNFEDTDTIEYLSNAFEKESELYEKNRLMTVIDRLSYQLSSIESLVLNLSEPLQEEKFIDIIQSSIAELLFCSASTFKVNGLKATKISEIGYIKSSKDFIDLDEILLSCIEMSLPLNLDDVDGLETLKEDKIKVIIPIGNLENNSFLIFITRDTKIEEEEKLFINTIFRIIQHFYTKQFIELIDFKEQLSLKTLRILHTFDSLIEMLKEEKNLKEKFIESIKTLNDVEKITELNLEINLPNGVYTSKEANINVKNSDIIISYPDTLEKNKQNFLCIKINSTENILELINIMSLILDGYETILNKKQKG
ncbi:hypothetical protein OSSY52_05840 [Tepiditoga spiralis]|uniref:Uncharacterized protein n=1 Tax=Tepiditoga spiralis TaxID=2108365 RepID=A0A7G1G6I6_9BACT|nr:hypothetical protein [Tepiditoga spiralis]BBE30443.1 hypothetical protein OSSY52_05840 [Tepiditoga spiralis]